LAEATWDYLKLTQDQPGPTTAAVSRDQSDLDKKTH